MKLELGAGFEGFCGFALFLALSPMREHGLGPFGRAEPLPYIAPERKLPIFKKETLENRSLRFFGAF